MNNAIRICPADSVILKWFQRMPGNPLLKDLDRLPLEQRDIESYEES